MTEIRLPSPKESEARRHTTDSWTTCTAPLRRVQSAVPMARACRDRQRKTPERRRGEARSRRQGEGRPTSSRTRYCRVARAAAAQETPRPQAGQGRRPKLVQKVRSRDPTPRHVKVWLPAGANLRRADRVDRVQRYIRAPSFDLPEPHSRSSSGNGRLNHDVRGGLGAETAPRDEKAHQQDDEYAAEQGRDHPPDLSRDAEEVR